MRRPICIGEAGDQGANRAGTQAHVSVHQKTH